MRFQSVDSYLFAITPSLRLRLRSLCRVLFLSTYSGCLARYPFQYSRCASLHLFCASCWLPQYSASVRSFLLRQRLLLALWHASFEQYRWQATLGRGINRSPQSSHRLSTMPSKVHNPSQSIMEKAPSNRASIPRLGQLAEYRTGKTTGGSLYQSIGGSNLASAEVDGQLNGNGERSNL